MHMNSLMCIYLFIHDREQKIKHRFIISLVRENYYEIPAKKQAEFDRLNTMQCQI